MTSSVWFGLSLLGLWSLQLACSVCRGYHCLELTSHRTLGLGTHMPHFPESLFSWFLVKFWQEEALERHRKAGRGKKGLTSNFKFSLPLSSIWASLPPKTPLCQTGVQTLRAFKDTKQVYTMGKKFWFQNINLKIQNEQKFYEMLTNGKLGQLVNCNSTL